MAHSFSDKLKECKKLNFLGHVCSHPFQAKSYALHRSIRTHLCWTYESACIFFSVRLRREERLAIAETNKTYGNNRDSDYTQEASMRDAIIESIGGL